VRNVHRCTTMCMSSFSADSWSAFAFGCLSRPTSTRRGERAEHALRLPDLPVDAGCRLARIPGAYNDICLAALAQHRPDPKGLASHSWPAACHVLSGWRTADVPELVPVRLGGLRRTA